MGLHSFSVDAQLLRELGERLVGRPHIALAELIKNSYDADATQVQLRFEHDQIVVTVPDELVPARFLNHMIRHVLDNSPITRHESARELLAAATLSARMAR